MSNFAFLQTYWPDFAKTMEFALPSDFKKRFFRFFKPLDNLFREFFDFLSGIFTADGAFPDKADAPALLHTVCRRSCSGSQP